MPPLGPPMARGRWSWDCLRGKDQDGGEEQDRPGRSMNFVRASRGMSCTFWPPRCGEHEQVVSTRCLAQVALQSIARDACFLCQGRVVVASQLAQYLVADC